MIELQFPFDAQRDSLPEFSVKTTLARKGGGLLIVFISERNQP